MSRKQRVSTYSDHRGNGWDVWYSPDDSAWIASRWCDEATIAATSERQIGRDINQVPAPQDDICRTPR